MKLSTAALAVAIGIFSGVVVYSSLKAEEVRYPDPYADTVLVGTGCEGPSTVAVAYEEDWLPRCDNIDIHMVSTNDPYR